MKELIYGIYALFFNFFSSVFKIKNNRVALVSMHNESFHDSLGAVYEEMKKRGEYDFVFITRQDLEVKPSNILRVLSFFLIKSRKLATAKYVFFNDNFLPMSKLKIKKEAVTVQLWHGEGVFKKFGLSIYQPDKVREREIKANEKIKYVICSSEKVKKYYAASFGVPLENVLALGSPRTDYFFQQGSEQEARKRIDSLYPTLRGKKIVLYAPTFRDDLSKNGEILSHFDFGLFEKELSDEYALAVRLHPQVHEKTNARSRFCDVTDFDDVRQLVLACDVLITDYSSICMDFSLLNKKTVFFAYDLEEYGKQRDFYFDYASYVPGTVAKDTAEVIAAIKAPFDSEKNEKFKRFNFDYCDAQNAKRVVDTIVG